MIACVPATHGALLVPIILGSDKTTVSVATGQHDYYPLYLSIGNLHNTACRTHKNGVKLIAFLVMPKSKYNLLLIYIHLNAIYTSYKGALSDTIISKVPTPALPPFALEDTRSSEAVHVDMETQEIS
jgi:hypothetical protein